MGLAVEDRSLHDRHRAVKSKPVLGRNCPGDLKSLQLEQARMETSVHLIELLTHQISDEERGRKTEMEDVKQKNDSGGISWLPYASQLSASRVHSTVVEQKRCAASCPSRGRRRANRQMVLVEQIGRQKETGMETVGTRRASFDSPNTAEVLPRKPELASAGA